MLVGLSYSRCIRDLVEGKVNFDEVLIVISRTNFDPKNDAQWAEIWNGYRSTSGFMVPEWVGYPDSDEDKFRTMTLDLHRYGKWFQPRQAGASMSVHRPEHWLKVVLPNTELEKNHAAKEAWDQFQVVAGLTGVTMENFGPQ